MNEIEHVPVLLEEALQALAIKPEGIYMDATFGRGGHAQEILNRLGARGKLLALDRDPQAYETARLKFVNETRLQITKGPFSMLGGFIDSQGLSGRIDGILFDLGVSSPQLEEAQRGFSFRLDGPLDMRMDPQSGESAAQWINRADESEIMHVIREYGEERFARRIARVIVRDRVNEPIATTRQLAEIVSHAVPTREAGKNPATRTFQAIRIYINRELDELNEALPQAMRVLAPGGRLLVISFHSLEDRIAKRFLRTEAKGGEFPPDMPVLPSQFSPRLRILGKAIRAGAAETQRNPRARSAVLRVAEKI